jgi:hypothetical protein
VGDAHPTNLIEKILRFSSGIKMAKKPRIFRTNAKAGFFKERIRAISLGEKPGKNCGKVKIAETQCFLTSRKTENRRVSEKYADRQLVPSGDAGRFVIRKKCAIFEKGGQK